MARYFTRPRALWVADEDTWTVDVAGHVPCVADHEPIDTGLLGASGDPIMRAPNPMGFGKDEDW
jgi:hypothetical protein